VDLHTEPHWDRCALITIDVQVDFTSGAMPVAGTTAILPNLNRLAQAFRLADRPIYHALRLYLPDGSNADRARRLALAEGQAIVLPGSEGSQLVEGLLERATELEPQRLLDGELQTIGQGEFAIYKPRWNAFFGTPLMEALARDGVDTVVIAGCNYPNCPRATAFGASERDLRTVMAADGLSGFGDDAAGEMARIGVQTMNVLDIVSALDG
jgi:nicotinamidase-related amidase